ncbi:MAG: protein kinase [Pyrinomonadaceae bacterium]
MTSERSKKIEEIYHAVLETAPPNRREFLQDHCGEDIELRLEIESLLSFEKTFYSVIDSPPVSLINEFFSEFETPSIIGSQINQYKILSLLGEGGMGTVYLAQDTKLERKVAVKFLSDNFVKEGSSLERFFREARSSSALNHPNIITVHEIGEFENRPFIATEFIDGITLKEYLTQAKITLTDLLDIAVQVASALSTAHKAGIIHRDIKPDNVMIRSDGIVKVLDFGLAKISQDSKEIDTEANTREKLSTIHGLIMGTPHFMSPEQARGKKVDKRTDIWSFGVLLYQMLTRKLPFQGETTPDIIASVLKSEPPPMTQFVPDISPELEKITLNALQKSRRDRYQTIDELLSELKYFRRNLEFGAKTEPLNSRVSEQVENEKITDAKLIQITAENSDIHSGKLSSIFSQTISTAKTHPVSFGLIFITIVSLFTAIVIGFSKQRLAVNQPDSFQKMKLAKLTFDGTVTNIAAVSPDGKYIVYALRNDGLETLLVRQIVSGTVIQLVKPAEVTYFGAVFSNDSNYVYYTVYDKDASNLFEIPALGGNPRKIVNDVSAKITFSPDGKTMAFIRAGKSLLIADNKGSAERFLAKAAEGEMWRYAAWNPDGKSIVVAASDSKRNEFLMEIATDSGEAKRLDSSNWTIITGLTWISDGSGLILSGRTAETKFSQLWLLSYPDGKLSHITNDFSLYIKPDLAADNKTLIAVKQEKLYNIWTSSDGTPNSLKKITVEEGKDDGLSGLASSPEGKIVYTVRIDDAIDIWIVNPDGSNNHQLTFDQASNYQPTVSPDGKYIVFISTRMGKPGLWRMNIDGSEQTALTENVKTLRSPVFTPDGKWIIYEQVGPGNTSTIWKINVEDKQIVQLTQTDSAKAAVSPDGKFFACEYGTPAKVAIILIDGGQTVKLLDAPLVTKSKMFLWAKDGKSLVYIDKRDRIYNLWAQPVSGEKPKQLTFFDSGQIYKFDLAADGKGFAFSRGNESSDVVMFNDFR